MDHQRVVCLNCIDGRVQLPVILWIKDNFNVDHVDLITEPGMDGFLANKENSIQDIVRKIRISIESNSAEIIFIVGHYDCKGNPVDESIHKDEILNAVSRIKQEFSAIGVKGLWVNSEWQIEIL